MSDDEDGIFGRPMSAQDIADELWRRTAADFGSAADRDRSWHKLLAHHEAGHIVAGWALRVTLGGVGVRPHDLDTSRPAGGVAIIYIGSEGGAVSIARLIVTLSGPAAARRFDRRQDDAGVYDREDVERGLSRMCRSPEAADIVRAHCTAEARRIVDENWDAIEVVAAALLEREVLNFDELSDIFAGVLADRANASAAASRAAWAAAETRAADFAAMCSGQFKSATV